MIDIELYSNQWDGEFVVRHAKFKQLNKAITQYVKKFDDIIKNIRKEGKDINLKNFNIFYNEKHVKSKSSFLDFAYDELQRRDLKWSTKRAHLIALEALKRSGVIKTFDDITPENIALFLAVIPTSQRTLLFDYYFFSSDNIFFILSSVNPKQDAKRLNALRLSVGISEYMLFIGVSLFIAFSICFFLIIIYLPFVYSNHTHTATYEHIPTSFPLYHPRYTEFPLHTELY